MKGITPSFLREASYSSIRMGLYDSIKALIAPKGTGKDDFSFWQKLVAGAGSGALGSFIATPTDLVKYVFNHIHHVIKIHIKIHLMHFVV